MTATLTDQEIKEGLDAARHLAEQGVPIFVGRPAMVDGVWDPLGGTGRTGYRLPTGWERTTADLGVIDRYRPGDALCAVMGHTVDDRPRSGGDHTKAGLMQAGMWPRSYGEATTPSGGTRSLVAPLGEHSRDAVAAGFDVKAGVDGDRHGFLFIAPTVKLNKVTGEIGAYRWTQPPDLDAIDGGDDSGQPIADMVQASRNGHKTADQPAGDPRPWMVADRIPFGSRYPWLLSYAGWLRDKNVRYTEAEHLMRLRWQACDQPPDALYPMPWADAEEILGKVYRAYEPTPELTDLMVLDDGGATTPDTATETELANARRLAAAFGDQIRYVVPWRKWLIWDGKRWSDDATGQVWRYAKKVADSIPAKKGSRTHSAAGIAAMINLAGTEPGIVLAPEALDTDPYLVNCQTGRSTCVPGSCDPTTRPT
jgi:hypothetical protein